MISGQHPGLFSKDLLTVRSFPGSTGDNQIPLDRLSRSVNTPTAPLRTLSRNDCHGACDSMQRFRCTCLPILSVRRIKSESHPLFGIHAGLPLSARRYSGFPPRRLLSVSHAEHGPAALPTARRCNPTESGSSKLLQWLAVRHRPIGT